MQINTLANNLKLKKLTLSTVESCTGGGIAARCTDVPGSSVWFLGGLVTYSNEMKMKLGVSEQAILKDGAVSETVVAQMAQLGRQYANSDWSIAVTGIAGPDGGSKEKPVGTVWIAWSNDETTVTECCFFEGDRAAIRLQTVNYSLKKLNDLLN